MTKEKIQEIAFKMIAGIGGCKYQAIEAFNQYKKDGDAKKATDAIRKAEGELGNIGTMHLEIISKEAANEEVPFSMILMHAEDQYMTTQTLIEMLLLVIK